MVGCLVDFCLLSTHIMGKLKKQLQLYVCTGVARWLFLYYIIIYNNKNGIIKCPNLCWIKNGCYTEVVKTEELGTINSLLKTNFEMFIMQQQQHNKLIIILNLAPATPL